MGKYGRARVRKSFSWMGGGLVTLPSDNHIESMAKGKLYATRSDNTDYTKRGSVSKARGWTKQGANVDGASAYYTQTTSSSTIGPLTQTPPQTGVVFAFASKFTAPASKSIASVEVKIASTNARGTLVARFGKESDGLGVYTGSASSPVTVTSDISSTTPMLFTFPTPPSLVSGTVYYLYIELSISTVQSSSATTTFAVYGQNSTGAGVTGTKDNWSSTVGFPGAYEAYSKMYATTPVIGGLWDLRYEDAGVLSQYYAAACGGALYAGDPSTVDGGGSWSGAIASGLASDKDSLYDMVMFKNIAFFTDYATNNNRAWDGVDGSTRVDGTGIAYGSPTRAQSTMRHGYRPAFNFSANSATGSGRTWSAATGNVRVMAVTQLKSGGYRTRYRDVAITANTDDINVSSLGITANYAEFYFDIEDLATTWFVSLIGQETGILYKVPTTAMSGGANPTANSNTGFAIYPSSDAQLTAEDDIETYYGIPQGYFTLQVDAPDAKGFELFNDMLCCWGDADNASRVWVSEQGGPQVFGTYGSTLGNFIDVAPEDGEIVTGIRVAGEALFVAKQHSLYRVDFTGDVNDPFRVSRVKGNLGTLSHWSMEEIPEGLYFMSELGPACCYGTYAKLLPSTENIRNLFDAGNPSRFNQSGLARAVSCNDVSRGLIYTTLSQAGSTLRDQVLVYDYAGRQFNLLRDFTANVIASIGNSSAFPTIWYGDYQGAAYIQNGDSGNTDNNGTAMPLRIDLPYMELGDGAQKKSGAFLWLSADVETPHSTMTIYVDVYVDNVDTRVQTLAFPATTSAEAALLRKGLAMSLAPMFKSLKLVIRCDGVKSLVLSSLDIDYSPEGQDL